MMLHLVKFLVVLCFLIYASKLDLRDRIIPNRVWKYTLLIGFPFVVSEFYLRGFNGVDFAVVQLIAVVTVAYTLYRLNAFGGADAKAIMVLAVLFPFYPNFNGFPILHNGFVFALSVLANSVICSPALILTIFIRNIFKEGLKIRGNLLYYFIGYRVNAKEIPKFHNLLEYFDENGRLIRVRRGIEPNDEILARLRHFAEKKNIEKIWVTPALPFLLFITVGYLIAFFIGDLLLFLISLVL